MTNAQPQLLQIALDPGDVVYTPDWVARDMVDFFKPSGRILEPCKGDGVFLKYLPPHTEWCEIQEGRDFFQWVEPVDWVFGNPPYKMYREWLSHSMKLADNILYLLPFNKPFNSNYSYVEMLTWGGFSHMRHYGNGRSVVSGFDFSFATGAVHFKRNYRGPMYTTIYGQEATP